MEPSPELAEIISDWFQSVASGDVGWRDRHVSRHPDLRIVGTDPEEWLSGEAAYVFLRDEAATVGGRVKVSLRDVEAFTEGTVGWGGARPVIALPDGSSVSPRWSGVFRREDGVWRLIQLHASVGVCNAEAFGDVLAPAEAAQGQ
jgi:hypothetical protein